MITSIRLRDLKLPSPSSGARQRSLEMVAQYRKAQAELEQRCKELGIETPVMTC